MASLLMGTPLLHKIALASGSLMLSVSGSQAWDPGTGNESAASGFIVDTNSRNDVISFWHCVYMQSEGYENRINWTGSISGGNPGTTSAAFQNDVLRRTNFYRAMAGLDASLTLGNSSDTATGSGGPPAPSGTSKYEAAQAAALMLSRNTAEFLSGGGVANGSHDPHNPPSSWHLDNATARNGVFYSNLSVGLYGPGAVDAFISEDDQGAGGAENNDVGHRRHIFSSRIQQIATGNVPATGSNYFAASAMYVSGNQLPPTSSPRFVPWPNAGFIPEAIVPQRWSMSYPEADFSSATVSMTDINNDPVNVTVVSRTAAFADNTLVWKPNPSAMDSAEFDDQVYSVTVSNIMINGSPVSHTYTVTVINPNRLIDYPELTGSSSPPDSGARYYFESIEHAEEYGLDVSLQSSVSWTEGAEDGSSDRIIDSTSGSYDLRASITFNGSTFWDTGGKSFRLAFPNNSLPLENQSFTLDRTLIPQSGANLIFRMQRGYITQATKVEVQTSTNGGSSWTTVTTYSGNGNGSPDNSFATYSIPLTSTGTETMVRFYFHQPNPTGVYDLTTYPTFPIGVFIDGITATNCNWLESVPVTNYAKTAGYVELNSTTGGGALTSGSAYILRLRARVGCHWFPFGPSMEVTPVSASSLSSYQVWFRGLYPGIGSFSEDYDGDGISNGLEEIFDLNPMDPSDGAPAIRPVISGNNLVFSHPVTSSATLSAECSTTLQTGSWNPVTVIINNGIATATVPLGAPACYFRWVAIEP